MPALGLAMVVLALTLGLFFADELPLGACLTGLILLWIMLVLYAAAGLGRLTMSDEERREVERRRAGQRTLLGRGVFVLILFAAGVGVILMAALARNETPDMGMVETQMPIPTWRWVVGGLIAASAAAVLFGLSRRYGPFITFGSGQPDGQPAAKRKSKSVVLLALLFVLAVGVIVMAALARNETPRAPQPSAPSYPVVDPRSQLISIGLSAGVTTLSLIGLGLTRYALPSKLKQALQMIVTPEDVSGEALTPPPAVQALANTLTGLGFARLGELRAKPAEGAPISSWLFASADRQTVALLTPVQGAEAASTSFISAFPDHARIETHYGTVTKVRYPDLVIGSNRHSLAVVWDQHRREIAAFDASHGRPIEMASAQFVDAAERAKTLHAPRAAQAGMRHFTALNLVGLVIGLAGLLIALVLGQWRTVASGLISPVVLGGLYELVLLWGIVRALRA